MVIVYRILSSYSLLLLYYINYGIRIFGRYYIYCMAMPVSSLVTLAIPHGDDEPIEGWPHELIFLEEGDWRVKLRFPRVVDVLYLQNGAQSRLCVAAFAFELPSSKKCTAER